MDDKKQIKLVLKAIGKKHIDMVREAVGDQLTIAWLSWEKGLLGNRTPMQAVKDGDAGAVKEMVEYLYDLSTLPPEPEEEELVTDLEEAESEEDE